MADKWLPPLLCPIPLNHPNHYLAESKRKTLLQQLFEKDPPEWADLSKMKSTWNRLFARRSDGAYSRRLIAKLRRKPGKYSYAIIDPNGKIVQTYKTLAPARQDLKKDSLKVKRRGRWVWRDLSYGSSVIHLRDSWDAIEDAMEALPIESKKCPTCPNKTSHQGQCACQFWAALRDGVQKHRWLTPHEVKMELKRRKKESDAKIERSGILRLILMRK